MKRNDFNEIKGLDIKSLLERVKKIREEIGEAMIDKQMGKLKDLKIISKKRKNLAQIMTVVRQKQLLEELESRVESQESSKNKSNDNKEVTSGL